MPLPLKTAPAFLLAGIVLACAGDSTAPAPVPTTVQISPSSVDLAIGGTVQLQARVLDQNGDPVANAGETIWSSSDMTRITVDATGLATGVRPGGSTISARVGALAGQLTATVLAPRLVVESARAVTLRIGVEGGGIEAQNLAGVRFRLDVPAGAVATPTDITVTPVGSMENSPFESLLGAVQLAPDGLVLLEPATLRIELPVSAPAVGLVGVHLTHDGSGFGYTMAERAGNVVTVPVPHFSGAGAASIDPDDPPVQTNTTAETNAFNAMIDEVLAAHLEGRAVNDLVFGVALSDWYDAEIKPGLEAAESSTPAFTPGISAWRYWLWMVNSQAEDFPGLLNFVDEQGSLLLAASAFVREITRQNIECLLQQNGVPPLRIFFLQWAAERFNLVTLPAGVELGLDRGTVLEDLCLKVVHESIDLADPLQAGQAAELRFRVGARFDTGSLLTSPAWPVETIVTTHNTTSDGQQSHQPVNGDISVMITPSGAGDVSVGLYTCIELDDTPPGMLDFTDVCAGELIDRELARQLVYENDFSSSAGPEWNSQALATSPSGERYLGNFANGAARLSLSNLPSHTRLTVEIDLYIINTWGGNDPNFGPDFITVSIDGATLLTTTFSNEPEHRQAYPDPYPTGDNPAGSGASATNSLGYPAGDPGEFGDATYRLVFEVDHTAATVMFLIAATNLQPFPDEYWGLDNVRVFIQ